MNIRTLSMYFLSNGAKFLFEDDKEIRMHAFTDIYSTQIRLMKKDNKIIMNGDLRGKEYDKEILEFFLDGGELKFINEDKPHANVFTPLFMAALKKNQYLSYDIKERAKKIKVVFMEIISETRTSVELRLFDGEKDSMWLSKKDLVRKELLDNVGKKSKIEKYGQLRQRAIDEGKIDPKEKLNLRKLKEILGIKE